MQLILLHTNDTHGHLNPLPNANGQTLGGYARRATVIKQQRADHEHVLLLDAGDFYQSTRFWHAFKGEPDIHLMNQLEYDVAALGNHDFDGGLDLIAKRIRQANFPMLCANMEPIAGHQLDGLWQPLLIKEIDGHRIGIFSLLVDDLPLYPPEFPASITCKPIWETARAVISDLSNQTDAIICLSHLGHDLDVAMAEQIEDIDLIIGGHTHTPLHEIHWTNGTPIVRGIVGSQFVGRTVLEIEDNAPPAVTEYRLVPLDDSIPDDPAVADTIKQWTAKLPKERSLGQLLTAIDTTQVVKAGGESAAGNLYVDALLNHRAIDAHIAFIHVGTLRGDRAYGPGHFTNLDLSEYHPFPNAPVTRQLNAVQLKLLLEWGVSALPTPSARYVSFAGLTVHVDLSRQPQLVDLRDEQVLTPGDRVIHVEYLGNAVDLNDASVYFNAAMDGFMGKGGAGFFFLKEAPLLHRSPLSGSDIVAHYIEEHSPISPQVEGRIKIIY